MIYQTLGDLVESVRQFKPDIRAFDTSVFDGIYVTGDVDEKYLTGLESERNDDSKSRFSLDSECVGLHNWKPTSQPYILVNIELQTRRESERMKRAKEKVHTSLLFNWNYINQEVVVIFDTFSLSLGHLWCYQYLGTLKRADFGGRAVTPWDPPPPDFWAFALVCPMLSQMPVDKRIFPDTDRETIDRLREGESDRVICWFIMRWEDLTDSRLLLMCCERFNLWALCKNKVNIRTILCEEWYITTTIRIAAQPFYRNETRTKSQRSSVFFLLEIAMPMGLLPAIDHAWPSTGGQLFLWNYKAGTRSLFIQKPWSGNLQCRLGEGKVRHVLSLVFRFSLTFMHSTDVFGPRTRLTVVIATSSLVVLHGVTVDRVSGKLQLAEHSLNTPSDNVRMSNIIGTDDGRIFMTGQDGHVYEVVYDKVSVSNKTVPCSQMHTTRSIVSLPVVQRAHMRVICRGALKSTPEGKFSFAYHGINYLISGYPIDRHYSRPKECYICSQENG